MRLAGNNTMLLAGSLLLVGGVGYGQSLGDVAREQRQKQQANAQPAPKVITNEDIPASSEADSSAKKSADSAARPSSSKKSAPQWKHEIQAQERVVTNLQDQIQKVSASVHYTNAPARTGNGVRYNERQEQKQDQVQRMQEQLERDRQKLADLQDAARKDGYGNAVYEP